MDTLELIQTKIAELEEQLSHLRIAEQEIIRITSRPSRQPPEEPRHKPQSQPGGKQKQKPGPKPKGSKAKQTPAHSRITLGSAIGDVITRQGPLSATEIAKHMRATMPNINNRSVSYTLQMMKKQGLVRKAADGNWTPLKALSRRQPEASHVQEKPEITN